MQVDVRSAVKIATEYLSDLFPDAERKRLEEVELRDDGWHVVISFADPNKDDEEPSVRIFSALQGGRRYKDVVLDANNGQPRAVKMVKA